MKTLKVGIMAEQDFQQRLLDIAAGRVKPKRGEPKIWFSSMKSLSEVLSDNNVRLLRIIEEEHPETISELAEISGRKISNLSRTLKTLERYGIVELRRNRRTVTPVAKASGFNIALSI